MAKPSRAATAPASLSLSMSPLREHLFSFLSQSACLLGFCRFEAKSTDDGANKQPDGAVPSCCMHFEPKQCIASRPCPLRHCLWTDAVIPDGRSSVRTGAVPRLQYLHAPAFSTLTTRYSSQLDSIQYRETTTSIAGNVHCTALQPRNTSACSPQLDRGTKGCVRGRRSRRRSSSDIETGAPHRAEDQPGWATRTYCAPPTTLLSMAMAMGHPGSSESQQYPATSRSPRASHRLSPPRAMHTRAAAAAAASRKELACTAAARCLR